MNPIHVVHRRRLAPGQCEAAIVNAWRSSTRAICRRAKGALGGTLYRARSDPPTYVAVMRWASLEDWQAFWASGPPDPEGDPDRNEILIEVAGESGPGAGSAEAAR